MIKAIEPTKKDAIYLPAYLLSLIVGLGFWGIIGK